MPNFNESKRTNERTNDEGFQSPMEQTIDIRIGTRAATTALRATALNSRFMQGYSELFEPNEAQEVWIWWLQHHRLFNGRWNVGRNCPDKRGTKQMNMLRL